MYSETKTSERNDFMRQFFAIAIISAAAALFSAPAANAANRECMSIDSGISYSSPKLIQDDSEMNCNLGTGQSIEVAEDRESFNLITGNYSFYKLQLQTIKPAAFEASGKELLTVFEVKVTPTLQNPDVEDYIPNYTYGMYITADGNSTFAGEGVAQKRVLPVDGKEVVIKYIINPVKKEIEEYKNDELITTTPFASIGSGDISQMRFYPRPLPGKNANGEYDKPNNKTTLDYGSDDGVVSLSTPIIWNFDYIKVYQIPSYEIKSTTPENGADGVGIAGPFTVTFDRDMDTDTINYTQNVQMINEVNGETLATVPMMFEPGVCTVYPAGMVEYFTKYRISFLNAVKDKYGFGNNSASFSFTTEKRNITEDVAYTDLSAPVSLSCGNVIAAGRITGKVRLNSNVDGNNIRLAAAVYDKTDNGYSFVSESEIRTALAKGENSIELPAVTVTDAEKQFIKYMVWDETGYPLTDAVICDSEHTGI